MHTHRRKIPGYAIGCIVVDSAEQEAQVLRLDVEPDVFQEKPELGAGEEAAPFRVVLVEDRLQPSVVDGRFGISDFSDEMVELSCRCVYHSVPHQKHILSQKKNKHNFVY